MSRIRSATARFDVRQLFLLQNIHLRATCFRPNTLPSFETTRFISARHLYIFSPTPLNSAETKKSTLLTTGNGECGCQNTRLPRTIGCRGPLPPNDEAGSPWGRLWLRMPLAKSWAAIGDSWRNVRKARVFPKSP